MLHSGRAGLAGPTAAGMAAMAPRAALACELSVHSCGAATVVATVAQAADAGPWQKAAPAAVEGRDRLSLCFGGARCVSPHQVHLSKGCDLGAHRGPCVEGLLRPLERRGSCMFRVAVVRGQRACMCMDTKL